MKLQHIAAARWVLAVTLVWVLPARAAEQVPVAVDLLQHSSGVVDGRRVPLPVTVAGDSRRLVQQTGTLDFFLRVPVEGVLVFELAPDVSDEVFAVSVAGGSASATPKNASKTLACERGAGNEWRASLAGFGGTPVRLRLQNRGADPLTWTKLRVTGSARTQPPVIDVDRSARQQKPRVNILLYVVDTLRLDRLSVYGYERPTSPNLEKLAQRGILFTSAYAPGPHTIPSITALFASRLPSELSGRLVTDGPAQHTLAEAFRDAGYETVAFQANFLLQPPLGYARGFEEYRLLKEETPEGIRYLSAETIHAQVVSWMEAHRDAPFFMYVQTMDVHWPYDAPAPFGGMFEKFPRGTACRDPKVLASMSPDDRRKREQFCDYVDGLGPDERKRLENFFSASPNRYDGGVAYADHQIGLLLEQMRALGLDERTVIVITADHGEPLWDRGEVLHGLSLFEELVHIPLLILLPWDHAERRVDEVVSLIDLPPTLLDIAGVPVPPEFLGHSMLRPRGPLEVPAAIGEQLQFQTNVPMSWYAREGPWKLIATQEGAQLFHLPSDPGEEHDVASRHPVMRNYLTRLLMDRSAAFRGEGPDAVPLGSGLSDAKRKDLEEALRALGYVQ